MVSAVGTERREHLSYICVPGPDRLKKPAGLGSLRFLDSYLRVHLYPLLLLVPWCTVLVLHYPHPDLLELNLYILLPLQSLEVSLFYSLQCLACT